MDLFFLSHLFQKIAFYPLVLMYTLVGLQDLHFNFRVFFSLLPFFLDGVIVARGGMMESAHIPDCVVLTGQCTL